MAEGSGSTIIDTAAHGVRGPFRAIEAEYEQTGGESVWGRPVRRDLVSWTFDDGCIVYDPRDERAHALRGVTHREWWPRVG